MELLSAGLGFELNRVVPSSSSKASLILSDVLTPGSHSTSSPLSSSSSRRQQLRSIIDAALQILDDDELEEERSAMLESESEPSSHSQPIAQ
eukprot:scaffold25842_cov198-Amphora_coffeaeformis.AAC.39